MAVVKFGKYIYNGIARVKITDSSTDKSTGVINMIAYTGEMVSLPFKKCESIRVECKSELQTLESDNCAIVIGNVHYAKVGNSLTVEGFVKDFTQVGNRVSVNKNIKVCYGTEKTKRESAFIDNKTAKSKVVHIDGNLISLSCSIHDQSIELVTIGAVQDAIIGNCLEVKGIVDTCQVSNMLICTMGKSKAKSTKQIVTERNQQKESMNKLFNDFFDTEGTRCLK